ncbi:MAG: MucR family transcriptional regulator [Pseudomonadota bacterium]
MTEQTIAHDKIMELTADIVAAHVANNHVPASDLPATIEAVFAKLSGLETTVAEETEPPVPAVPIKKSVTDDYLICLEDGKKLKMLKRHLSSAFDMTPEDYRAKWGLPYDYPMVAPNYAKKRQELAKKIGLGRKPAATEAPKPKSRSRRKATS